MSMMEVRMYFGRSIAVLALIGAGVLGALSISAGQSSADMLGLSHRQAQALYLNSTGPDEASGLIKNVIPGFGWGARGMDEDDYVLRVDSSGTVRATKADNMPLVFAPLVSGLDYYDLRTGTYAGVLNYARSTTATYLNSDGLICTAAVDEPRFGFYNMTSPVFGGLLVESVAVADPAYNITNYCADSAAFDNWSASNITVTADSASAPVFGNTTSADTLRASDATGFVSYSTTAKASSYYNFSVYLKGASAATGGYVSIGKASDGFTNSSTVLTTGWQRFSVSANLTTATEGVEARIFNGQTTINVYAFGGQVENLSFPTSYIPTAGATVTRGRDDVYFAKTSGFDNAGTIALDITPLWGDADKLTTDRHIVGWASAIGFPLNHSSVLYLNGFSLTDTAVKYNDGTTYTVNVNQSRNTPYNFAVQWSAAAGTCEIFRDDASILSNSYDGAFYESAQPNICLGFKNYLFIKNLVIFDRSDVEVGEW